MISNGYREKVESYFEKSSDALKKWIDQVAEDLEAKGFKKVEKFSV